MTPREFQKAISEGIYQVKVYVDGEPVTGYQKNSDIRAQFGNVTAWIEHLENKYPDSSLQMHYGRSNGGGIKDPRLAIIDPQAQTEPSAGPSQFGNPGYMPRIMNGPEWISAQSVIHPDDSKESMIQKNTGLLDQYNHACQLLEKLKQEWEAMKRQLRELENANDLLERQKRKEIWALEDELERTKKQINEEPMLQRLLKDEAVIGNVMNGVREGMTMLHSGKGGMNGPQLSSDQQVIIDSMNQNAQFAEAVIYLTNLYNRPEFMQAFHKLIQQQLQKVEQEDSNQKAS